MKAPSIDYKVSLKTASRGAFRLVTEHAKNPIPVTLDLVLEDDIGAKGTIDVEPVKLSLFRREARLNNLVVNLRPDVSASPLRGELVVDYAEYVITVKLLGTIGDTVIELESDPPLEKNDALAVLIFGQPINRLTSEQGSSVASLESALGGGLSLASLYALASTPVEQISYDPNTKLITARIRLDEKTSITVGMGTGGNGARTVGGRRRIGERWVIGTDVIEDAQTGESRVSTFLEWHYRY